jgi:hypothetical protein
MQAANSPFFIPCSYSKRVVSRTGRHRRPFFDVSVLNAMSTVPLASGEIVHAVGNDVGVKQCPVARQSVKIVEVPVDRYRGETPLAK